MERTRGTTTNRHRTSSNDRILECLLASAFILALLASPCLGAPSGANADEGAGEEKGGLIRFGESGESKLEELRAHEGRTVTRIEISGNHITKPWVITREIETQVGQPLSVDTVDADLQRLENLDIFGSVEVLASEDGEGAALEYEVTEMPWILPYVAFRYTEDDGFSIGPAASSLNLLGRDIKTSGRVLFGGTFTFELLFSWPWIAGDHISLDLFAAHLVRDDPVRQFEETSDEITPWIGTYLGRHGRAAIAFSYFRMKSDIDSVTIDSDNTDDLSRIGVSLGYDSRDSWRVPRRGWHNELEVWRTGGPLGGDGDFWTFNADIRRYQPTFEKQTVAAGMLLTMQTGTVGVDVPSYMQYHLGGANSIRGYDNVELGRDLFGKNQLIGTVEYKYLLLPISELVLYKWPFSIGAEAAAFVDVGIAWSDERDFSSERRRTGFGVGFRPLVPAVELIRLDLGINTDGKAYFHLGVRSKFEAQRLRIR